MKKTTILCFSILHCRCAKTHPRKLSPPFLATQSQQPFICVIALAAMMVIPSCTPPNPIGGAKNIVTLKAPSIWDGEAEILWKQKEVDGVPAVALDVSDSNSPTFLPPEDLDVETVFEFEASVTINEITTVYPVVVRVLPATLAPPGRPTPNWPPVAQAEDYKVARVGEFVTLDGGTSTDPDCPDGSCLIYDWEQVQFQFADGSPASDCPTVAISAVEGSPQSAGFAPVEPCRYTFQLSVTDGSYTVSHIMAVDVRPASGPCQAVACLPGLSCIDGACAVQAPPCAATECCVAADCDDANTCTIDECTSEGVCENVEMACNDNDPCTIDRCEDGVCFHDQEVDAIVVTDWRDSSESVNVDITWQLPSGSDVTVARSGWETSGAESAQMSSELLPDGLHRLTAYLDGAARTTDLAFNVCFPGYYFAIAERFVAPVRRNIGVEVHEGQARAVFNDWLPTTDPEWIRTTGVPSLEYVGGWQQAAQNVHIDLNLLLPTNTWAQVDRQGWDKQGFERIVLPNDIALVDGTYQAEFFMDGAALAAETGMILRVGDLIQRYEGPTLGRFRRVIGLDVTGGEAHLIFNGWVNGVDGAAGSLTGVHVVEINSGWREATANMHVDINLRWPSGAYAPVWRNGWNNQGFERIVFPAGTPLENGTYTLEFFIDGVSNQAAVSYQAQLANWKYEIVDRILNGRTTHSITVNYQDGVATEISNTWRE